MKACEGWDVIADECGLKHVCEQKRICEQKC